MLVVLSAVRSDPNVPPNDRSGAGLRGSAIFKLADCLAYSFWSIFQSIQSFLNLHEFMNDDDVRLHCVDADRTIVAVNELLNFGVGFFVNFHMSSHAGCYK